MVIALALESDRQHQRAKALVSGLLEPVGVPNAVLVESLGVLWPLLRDSRFLSEWCNALSKRFDVVAEPAEVVQNALNRYADEHKRFSLVDCELIEWKKTTGFDVLTFDGGLEKELLQIK
ncbi:hypothetical protein HY572_01050 [Candidatus Micrarchaeota archaeon]|nr:hypothetical protein [Candidatus Micrarchaeota archaeon]